MRVKLNSLPGENTDVRLQKKLNEQSFVISKMPRPYNITGIGTQNDKFATTIAKSLKWYPKYQQQGIGQM